MLKFVHMCMVVNVISVFDVIASYKELWITFDKIKGSKSKQIR